MFDFFCTSFSRRLIQLLGFQLRALVFQGNWFMGASRGTREAGWLFLELTWEDRWAGCWLQITILRHRPFWHRPTL